MHSWLRVARHLSGAFFKPLAIISIVLAIGVSASAYTLVLRDGRRIEIPDEFILTRTTLTYELSPGFNQTLLLTLVDVPGTERANGEPLGGFFKHREAPPAPAPANNSSQPV